MNEMVIQKSLAFIDLSTFLGNIGSNSYFTEKGHFFHIFFVQYHVMWLLFQMSCGEQLKRSNGKTSFVNRLNN